MEPLPFPMKISPRELYERAVERLAEMGLLRYEISNFARDGSQSRHNLKYWQLEPYVGFGLDAHSFDGRRRWNNPDNLETYFATREAGFAACATSSQPAIVPKSISLSVCG